MDYCTNRVFNLPLAVGVDLVAWLSEEGYLIKDPSMVVRAEAAGHEISAFFNPESGAWAVHLPRFKALNIGVVYVNIPDEQTAVSIIQILKESADEFCESSGEMPGAKPRFLWLWHCSHPERISPPLCEDPFDDAISIGDYVVPKSDRTNGYLYASRYGDSPVLSSEWDERGWELRGLGKLIEVRQGVWWRQGTDQMFALSCWGEI